jgi:hypothetical protein
MLQVLVVNLLLLQLMLKCYFFNIIKYLNFLNLPTVYFSIYLTNPSLSEIFARIS